MNHIGSASSQTIGSIKWIQALLAAAVRSNTVPSFPKAAIAVMTETVESGQDVTVQRRSAKGERAELPGQADCPTSGV
jgi:hypothetical protein